MKKYFKSFMSIVMICGLFIVSGCGGGSNEPSGEEPTAATDTINIEMITAPVGMHPLKTNDAPSSTVSGQIFETLYMRSYDGTTYEPLLAEELPEFSEDGLTATIKLRQNVTFQDGTPFTADAVAYMIDSIKDSEYGALRPSVVESIESYEIIDDYTIQLNMAYEDGVLVAKLAHTNASIVNPELDSTKDLMVDPSGAGTGPYQFNSAITGSNYQLDAYEGYWGGDVDIKHINFDVIVDEATAIARLQTGDADFFASVSANSFDTVSAIPGFTTENVTSSSIYFLALRSHEESALNPLMANKDFRTAIIQAIDIPSFVESMLGDTASHSYSIVGPTLVGYTEAMEEAGIRYDQEAARATIEANGWTGETITMLCATRQWQQDLAVYIQSQLAEVGITMNIVSEEWASFLTTAREDQAGDIIILSWSNVTGDGQQMLEPNFSTTNGLRVKYNNAEFDALVDASARTSVLEERQQYMLEAVQKIQGDAIVTPLYSANQLYTYNSEKFDNVQLDQGGLYYVKDFTVVE